MTFYSCGVENQNSQSNSDLLYIFDCQEGYVVEQFSNQKAVVKKEGLKLYEIKVDTVGCITPVTFSIATIVGKDNL